MVKPRPFSGVDCDRSNVESLLKSTTVHKAVLSRSYDITYIISERDICLPPLEIGAIPSAIVKVRVAACYTGSVVEWLART